MIELLKKGSGIHIKPENKGKFTKYCNGKVTSACIQKGKNSPDPKIRKRATFAANARKWKHENGGRLIQFNQQGGWFRKAVDNISNGFWSFGDKTGLYDKSGFNHMISDLQDFGILAKGGENGQSYGIVAPGVLNAERTITVPKGMSGETLSDVVLASSSNPAFNEAERLALLDFQRLFGAGMPLATRRGRPALKDAFGNNVRYPDEILESFKPSTPPTRRVLYLDSNVTGRLLQATKNRRAGVKTNSQQSRQAAYRDAKLEMREDVEMGQASRTALLKAKEDAKWAAGDTGNKRGRKPVKRYRDATQDLLKNRPDSWEANQAGTFLRNYTNAKDPAARSRWLEKWSLFIDDLKNKGILGMEW